MRLTRKLNNDSASQETVVVHLADCLLSRCSVFILNEGISSFEGEVSNATKLSELFSEVFWVDPTSEFANKDLRVN